MQQELNPQPDQPGANRAVEEAKAYLASILQVNPLPETPSTEPNEHEPEGVYAVGSEAATSLNCVAIVRNGKIMPIVELEEEPEPRTAGEKMFLFTLTAHTIIGGLLEAIALAEARRRRENGEDKGDGCHV